VKIFSALYARVMGWAEHPHATRYLAGLSFAESSFFPIPPDVMLAPMSLARPDKAMWYATLTMVTSVLGGVFGYLIGLFAFEMVEPLLHKSGYISHYNLARQWFEQWGFWAVLLAGFSPIPYKVFTIAAGVVTMNLPLFVLASLAGRGGRFYLVSALMAWGGQRMDGLLRRYIDWLGWITVLLVVLFLWYLNR
jgi:membrane protein YqaA with SNARE-associated domain